MYRKLNDRAANILKNLAFIIHDDLETVLRYSNRYNYKTSKYICQM